MALALKVLSILSYLPTLRGQVVDFLFKKVRSELYHANNSISFELGGSDLLLPLTIHIQPVQPLQNATWSWKLTPQTSKSLPLVLTIFFGVRNRRRHVFSLSANVHSLQIEKLHTQSGSSSCRLIALLATLAVQPCSCKKDYELILSRSAENHCTP